MDLSKLRNYANGINQEDALLTTKLVAKVVGVTFEGRQSLLEKMSEDTSVKLERDRRNVHDPYAVKVVANIGGVDEQVGFVPKLMAKKISGHLDSGGSLYCEIKRITGGTAMQGTGERLNYGLEIIIKPEE